jgi:transposase
MRGGAYRVDRVRHDRLRLVASGGAEDLGTAASATLRERRVRRALTWCASDSCSWVGSVDVKGPGSFGRPPVIWSHVSAKADAVGSQED